MKKTLIILIGVAILALSSTAGAFQVNGLQNPYGVVVDPKTNFIYVSNVNGSPNSKDNNGFITRVKGDGQIDELRFLDGAEKKIPLHAPKGLAIVSAGLYVADIDKLRVFDLDSKKHIYDINFGELSVQHLFDVKVGPDGAVYVADGPGNTIYRVDPKKQHEVTVLATGAELGQPHGLVWYNLRQIFTVAGWSSGKVTSYDRSGKHQITPAIFLRTLEGIDADDSGNMYVASTVLGGIYRIAPNFAIYAFRLGLPSPAGVAFHRAGNQILVTSFDAGSLTSYPLEGGAQKEKPPIFDETPKEASMAPAKEGAAKEKKPEEKKPAPKELAKPKPPKGG